MRTDIINYHYNKVILTVPNFRFPLYCIVFVTLIKQGFVITSKFLLSQGARITRVQCICSCHLSVINTKIKISQITTLHLVELFGFGQVYFHKGNITRGHKYENKQVHVIVYL